MHYRSLCMAMLLTAAPAAVSSNTHAAQVEGQSYQQMYRHSQEHAHRLIDCFEHVQDKHDLSKETASEINTAIATLEWFATADCNGHNDLINIVSENQVRAQQLNEIISNDDILHRAHELSVPYIDTDASCAALEDVQTATQELINDAIEQLHETDWNHLLRNAQKFCRDWHLDVAGLVAIGATGTGLAYYYLAPEMHCDDITYFNVLQKIGRYAAGTGAVMTYWTRNRTPEEIENFSFSALKPALNTYKQALKSVGLPGNMSKRPVMHGDPTTLPDAETYRKEGKAKGYRVVEERIPEDVVDFKLWNTNILDGALLALGWNCVMGQDLISKDEHKNDLQRAATLLTPVIAALPGTQ